MIKIEFLVPTLRRRSLGGQWLIIRACLPLDTSTVSPVGAWATERSRRVPVAAGRWTICRSPFPVRNDRLPPHTSTLATCLKAAPNFQLSEKAAKDIVDRQIGTIRDAWDDICEEAALTEVERNLFGLRMFLNDHVFKGTTKGLW